MTDAARVVVVVGLGRVALVVTARTSSPLRAADFRIARGFVLSTES